MTKLIHMIRVTVLRSFRDFSTNIILIAMPLALIFILGTTFSSQSSQGFDLSDMTVHLSGNQDSDFVIGLENVLKETLTEESKIVYSTYENSKPLLENNQITCFIEIDDRNQQVTIYKNQLINFDASMIEGVVRTFTNRTNTIYTIAMVNPEYLSNIDHSDNDITERIGLDRTITLTAKDYYGVSMIILFVMYGVMTPVYEILSDRETGLLNRMEVANVRPLTVLMSKMIGYTLVSAIRVYAVVIIATMLTDIYWGINPILPMLYILAFLTTLTAVGIAVGYSIKEVSSANSIINIFIVFSAFMGGSYIQIDNIPVIKDLGKYVSINWWANKGLMTSIFSNDNTILFQGLIMCAVVTVVLSVVGIYSIQKGEKKFDR